MVLILTPQPGKFKTWQLVEDFTEHTSSGPITVPKGSTTDLASVPRMFWWLIPPFGRYTQAAVIHDYLYYTNEVDRKTADKIFYELMIKYDTYKWKAKLMYWAVRVFGRFVYKKRDKLQLVNNSSIQKLKKDIEHYNKENGKHKTK